MKNKKAGALLALLTLSFCFAFAQTSRPPLNIPDYSKPKIFADLPEKMSLRIASTEGLLDQPVGATISATIAKGFTVAGTVVSKSNPDDTTVKSVVIRTNRQGAIFTFSRIRKKDGSLSYIGRMLNRAGGDALEIVQEGKEYVIRKKGLYDMLNE